ncbi:MAG: (2Fe-2S)-binding protein [Candidatus Odinarchaeota archaeon]|nr:(2Fe-2S)-binding protein [Candidatus Odinarchaeota archaeon]
MDVINVKKHIQLKINGQNFEVDVEPTARLLDVLRDLGFVGVKEGCGTGECGACTVLLNGKSILSCLLFAVQADGKEIITVEGLAQGNKLHPVQEAFIEHGAVQCGYCIPGFIMSSVYLLSNNPKPTREEIREELSGNLCRCTGYVKIIDAVEAAAKKLEGQQ